MLDHIFLFIYIISVGVTFSALALSLLYWLRNRNSSRFNTFLFIAYLAVLLILSGVKFYWEELLSGGPGVTVGTGLAEFVGYALLLYFLPATVNHIIGRRWTGVRMAAAITASTVYFSLGAVYLFTGFLNPISLAAAFLYFLALAIILIDIVRSVSLIQRSSSRIVVLFITLITVTFLPLAMISRILGDSDGPWIIGHSLRFLLLSLYYFWMALAGVVFYLREMITLEESVTVVPYTVPEDLPVTDRERDIAESLAQGLTYGEIAENLGISPNTVRNHVANIYKKLSVRSKVELIGVLRGERAY